MWAACEDSQPHGGSHSHVDAEFGSWCLIVNDLSVPTHVTHRVAYSMKHTPWMVRRIGTMMDGVKRGRERDRVRWVISQLLEQERHMVGSCLRRVSEKPRIMIMARGSDILGYSEARLEPPVPEVP